MINYRRKYKEIRKDIATFGQHVITMVDVRPWSFAYTIGNAERGLPELLLIGVSGASSVIILNMLGEQLRMQRAPFATGIDVFLHGVNAVRLITANDTAKRDYTLFVGGYYGRDNYIVQQVIVPDPFGKFPGQIGCLKPYDDVPILFSKRVLI